MVIQIYINGSRFAGTLKCETISEVKSYIQNELGLFDYEFYLTQNGKLLNENNALLDCNIHATLRLNGGKGGFGSMLRAIGAQIEKTTNREACRDLSGRRLRDINEEKRLKTFLEKQKEKEDDTDDKKKKKLERMLMKPKHEFKDEAYEQARQDLTQQIDDAVEQGFKKVATESIGQKRKSETDSKNKDKKKKKKKNPALWLGVDDLSSSTESDDSDSGSASPPKNSTTKIETNIKE